MTPISTLARPKENFEILEISENKRLVKENEQTSIISVSYDQSTTKVQVNPKMKHHQ